MFKQQNSFLATLYYQNASSDSSKGLKWQGANKAVHQMVNTPQSNKYTRFYTLTNINTHDNKRQDIRVPIWLLNCTCNNTPCACHARLTLGILYIIDVPNNNRPPLTQTTHHILQMIGITFCHDRFPMEAMRIEHVNYNPLIAAP